MKGLLADCAANSARYLAGIRVRRVAPCPEDIARLEALGGPLPQSPSFPADTLALLDEIGSPATVATTGGRYFGFVIGGTLPAALAANWLAGARNQNAGLSVMSPVAARIEEIVLGWILELLGLPATSGAGFVTGTTVANFTALAAGRTALLSRVGWDVEEDGLFGAPPIGVVVGEEADVSLLKALSLLGLGRSRIISVPAEEQGRMRADALMGLDNRTLICIQAGNVNGGAFDPAPAICSRAREAGAWVPVDGAFGLWAAVSPRYSELVGGFSLADSWAIDCHKWLNVPYDSGMAVVRQPEHLLTAMSMSAAYLQTSGVRQPCHYTPEASHRPVSDFALSEIRQFGSPAAACQSFRLFWARSYFACWKARSAALEITSAPASRESKGRRPFSAVVTNAFRSAHGRSFGSRNDETEGVADETTLTTSSRRKGSAYGVRAINGRQRVREKRRSDITRHMAIRGG